MFAIDVIGLVLQVTTKMNDGLKRSILIARGVCFMMFSTWEELP